MYHPEKYKKRFCSYYPNNTANCEYGNKKQNIYLFLIGIFCSFAHSE